MDEWVRASDNAIRYEWTDSPDQAAIIVNKRMYKAGQDDIDRTTRRGGETHRQPGPRSERELGQALITLVEKPNEKAAFPIFLHEIGHALGLEHIYLHDSVMETTSSPTRKAVTDYDKKLIYALYNPNRHVAFGGAQPTPSKSREMLSGVSRSRSR